VGRLLRRIAAGAAVALAAFLLLLCVVWPPPSWWKTHWPAETAFMAMRDKQFGAKRDSTPRRYDPVPSDSMSPWLLSAAAAGEDEAFYSHHGIDYRAVREAIGYRRAAFSWGNAKDRAELRRALGRAWGRRDRLRGASTITQQLAKNLYLSPSRNPLRKLKEAAAAYRLEWALNKHRILELYLNVAEFGPNVWGVAAASERYFGLRPGDLSIEQAAFLVATLPRPLTSNPAFRPGAARWRQQLILRKLHGERVVIPPAEAEDTAPPPPLPQLDTALPTDTAVVPDTARPRDITHARPDTANPRTYSAAAPIRPDTAAVPPRRRPAPSGAGSHR
jgi:monofunctional biosynthetic peptidoglycan transglycosylase